MAEAIGLVSAVLTITETTAKLIKYCKEVRDAPKEKDDLAAEARGLQHILIRFNFQVVQVEEGEVTKKWQAEAEPLEEVLAMFQKSLDEVVNKLTSGSDHKKWKALKWPHDAKIVKEGFSRIERLKSLIQCAMLEDTNVLVRTIQKDTEDLRSGVTKIESGVDEIKSKLDAREQEELIKWLSEHNFHAKQDQIFGDAMHGTGMWFMNSPVLEDWIQGHSRVLWCPGIAGAGKTVIASILVNHLQRKCSDTVGSAVLCTYFDYSNSDQQTLANVYGDLLVQIIKRQLSPMVELYDDIRALKFKDQRFRAKEESVLELLRQEVYRWKRIFIVIDALDELLSESMQQILIRTISDLGPSVSLLVTSRPLQPIENMFDEAPQIRISAKLEDLQDYVSSRIRSEGKLSTYVKADPEFEKEVTQSILTRAQEMFLLVRLHVDGLVAQKTRAKVKAKLAALPENLNATYEGTMSRINQQDEESQRIARAVLSWIHFAVRPLTLLEMQLAIAAEPGQDCFDNEALVEADDIVACCHGLVVVNQSKGAQGEIRLAHYTIQEFLGSIFDEKLQSDLAKMCLTFLMYREFDKDFHESSKNQPLLNGFAQYAACNWGKHAHKKAEGNAELLKLALKFLKKKHRTTDRWLSQHGEDKPSGLSSSDRTLKIHRPRGLHIAAMFGLKHVVTKLIASTGELEVKDKDGFTALHYAAWHGRHSVAKTLLEKGAEVDARDSTGLATPLLCAARTGNKAVAEVLMEYGANVEAECSWNTATRPLMEAIRRDQVAIARLLIRRGAKVSYQPTDTASLLEVACAEASPDMINLLIDNGVPITGEHGIEAMRKAVSDRRPDTVLTLLNRGYKSNKEYSISRVMDHALRYGWASVVQKICAMETVKTSKSWSLESPLIQLYAKESWFPVLEAMCVAEPHSDTDAKLVSLQQTWRRDEVRHYLETGKNIPFNNMLKRPFYKDKPIDPDVTQDPYLEFIVPEDFTRVERIVIQTESHDQGWSESFQWAHGSYRQSYTWFDLCIEFRSEEGCPLYQNMVQKNVNSKKEYKEHINIWAADNYKDVSNADAIWRIKKGDLIRLYARAMFTGWSNHVRSASIELHGWRKAGDSSE